VITNARSMRTTAVRHIGLCLGLSLGFAICPCTSQLSAQERPDSLRIELARLAALVDSLALEVERLSSEGDDEEAGDALAELRAAAEAAAAAGGEPAPEQQDTGDFVGRERSLQSLNPEISVNADLLVHIDSESPGEDNFIPRDFELSIQSSLDPFSRAALFIAQDNPGGEIEPFAMDPGPGGDTEEEEGSLGIEEGYVEWVSLPGGFGLKLGRFFQRFGTLNRWHIHALPFESRSLPHIAFFGGEPLGQTGASVSWLAPFSVAGGTFEGTVEVGRGENEALFGEPGRLTLLTHLNAFWALSRSTDLDVGLSWIGGDFENDVEAFRRNAYTVEMAFNWAPPARSRQTGLVVRGGYMLLDGLNAPATPPPAGSEARETAAGFWSLAELRLSPSWLVGARFDRVENPAAPDVTQWLASPTLTWWQSEFVRLRVEYDFLSGLEGGDGSGRFILQTTFAMGPHKHSTY